MRCHLGVNEVFNQRVLDRKSGFGQNDSPSWLLCITTQKISGRLLLKVVKRLLRTV